MSASGAEGGETGLLRWTEMDDGAEKLEAFLEEAGLAPRPRRPPDNTVECLSEDL